MIRSAPFPRATRVLALAILFVGSLAVFSNIADARRMDFISYWAAAVLATGGKAAAVYDIAAHEAVQQGVAAFAGGGMPFFYPPAFLILLLPLGLLPYAVAATVWIATTFLAYLAVARRYIGSAWLAAAFPPVLVNAIIGQIGYLSGALIVAGTLGLARRPFLSGLLLGCLVIKPQLAVLLPFALIAGREWRAFAGAAVSSVGLLLLGLLLFGVETYAAMIRIAPLSAAIVTDGLVGWEKMASVYAALRLAGASAHVATAAHAVVALAALAMTCEIWRRPLAIEAKAAVLAGATALTSPYLYIHDTTMLIVPFAWLLGRGRYHWPLAMLWCLPLLSMAESFGLHSGVNLMPIIPIALLSLIGWELVAGEGRRSEAFG